MIDGIDVSKYQTVDWKKVAESGKIVFAFCKATDGQLGVDPKFKTHWAGIKKYGLVRGAYHFAQPDMSMNDPIIEADHFVDTVGPLDPEDMLCLDIEKAGDVPVGVAFTSWVLAFLERVEKRTGVLAIVYSGGPFFDQYDGTPSADVMKRLARYPFWLAAYVKNPDKYIAPEWKHLGWTFWQKSGDVAAPGETPLHVPGISSVVDYDVYKGTVEELKAFAASLHIPEEVPVPVPLPDPTPMPDPLPVPEPQPLPEPFPEPFPLPDSPPNPTPPVVTPASNFFTLFMEFLAKLFGRKS